MLSQEKFVFYMRLILASIKKKKMQKEMRNHYLENRLAYIKPKNSSNERSVPLARPDKFPRKRNRIK